MGLKAPGAKIVACLTVGIAIGWILSWLLS